MTTTFEGCVGRDEEGDGVEVDFEEVVVVGTKEAAAAEVYVVADLCI